MGMALSGLASGFDWKSIVDQLIEVSRAPQTRMRREQTTNSQKSSALTDIQGKLASLKTSVAALNSQDSLLKKSATIADKNSNWTATATKDTPAGDYNVELMSQATTTVLRGRPDIGEAVRDDDELAKSWLGSTITAGTFTINGKQITINPSTDRWGDVVKKIEESGAGVIVDWNRRTPPDYPSFKDDIFTLKTGSANWADPDWQSWGSSPPTATPAPGSITLGAANDTSNFLQVLRLYNSGVTSGGGVASVSTQTDANPQEGSIAHGMGMLRLDLPLANSLFAQAYQGGVSSFGNVSGSFKVNGATINYTPSTTVQDILNNITASSAGVSATYDRKYDQIVLQNKTPGNVAINIDATGDDGNVADGLGLIPITDPSRAGAGGTISQTLGQNATFRINGGGILQAQSSTLTETDHGIKGLTINANSLTTAGNPTKITVAGDTSAAKDALNDFVAKYNDVQNTIEKYTKVTTTGGKVTSSILSGNTELSSISRKLRAELTKSSGLSGTINRLSDLGVSSSGIQNTISFNSSVLESKLASVTDDVTNFFKDTNTTTGFMARFKTNFLDKLVTDAGSATGGLQAQLNTITKQNTSLDKQIAEVETRLASQRSLLEGSFIAMEKAQSQYQQQGAYLAKTYSSK